MAAASTNFKPLTLLQTRTYPGYQFYAHMKYDGHTQDQCMKYAVLTYMEWIRQKIGGSILPEELNTPPAKQFAEVPSDFLKSYHDSGGFTLDITSLPSKGIWASRIKEPDVERDGKKAVIGRLFVTECAFRRLENSVEIAVRIDVVDPIDVEDEVPFAFRPAFLRKLFETKKLRIRQVELLKYNQAARVTDSKDVRRLINLIHSPDNFMPIVVLTHATERKSVMEMIVRLDQSLGLTGSKDSLSARLNQCSLVPEMLEIGNPVLPYDADYIAHHSFGYGRVFVINEKNSHNFCRKLGKLFSPGDMLIIHPARFGGDINAIAYDPNSSLAAREYERNKLLEDIHQYSKHKPYSFGTVLFEAAARRVEIEDRIHAKLAEFRSEAAAENEKKADALYRETQELLQLYDSEKAELEKSNQRLQQENQKLIFRLAGAEARQNRQRCENGIVVQTPEVEEFYEDEQRDLILSVLSDAVHQYSVEGSRAEELLLGIVAANEVTGEGKRIMDRLKTILFRNNNITDSDISDLKALGFEVSRHANNHYKLVFKGDPRYSFTLPSTSSDVRSMKNSFSDIARKISVYK